MYFCVLVKLFHAILRAVFWPDSIMPVLGQNWPRIPVHFHQSQYFSIADGDEKNYCGSDADGDTDKVKIVMMMMTAMFGSITIFWQQLPQALRHFHSRVE